MITSSELNAMVCDIPSHFSRLMDLIIYYDGVSEDQKAWDIIYKIEQLDDALYLELMIADVEQRHFENQPTLLYNALLYGIVNDADTRDLLIQKLKETSHPQFCDYLVTLDTKQDLIGDKNVEYVLRNIDKNN